MNVEAGKQAAASHGTYAIVARATPDLLKLEELLAAQKLWSYQPAGFIQAFTTNTAKAPLCNQSQ